MAHVELERTDNRTYRIRLYDSDGTEVHDVDFPVDLLDIGEAMTLRTSDRFKVQA